MVLDSRVTWDKLALELELLSSEDPRSLVPLLVGIHSILRGDEHQGWCTRTINFLSFELAALCEGLPDQDRHQTLNKYFFETKDFQICEGRRGQASESDLLVRDVLSERSGSSLCVALLYLHLATEIDLPMNLVNVQNLNVLKWNRGSRCSFLDINQNGRLLGDEDLLGLINEQPGLDISTQAEQKLEVLSLKTVLLSYLDDLTHVYRKVGNSELLHATLSMILKLDSNNLKYLGDRALLRKEMGFEKESMTDLKRYFSFVEIASAPNEIQKAFKEISAFSSETPEVLH